MKVSKKYNKMADLYRRFASPWKASLDFSRQRLEEMYQYESLGKAIQNTEDNGFFQGKKWMDVTISIWKEDIADGILFLKELYADESLPNWWLDKIFGDGT